MEVKDFQNKIIEFLSKWDAKRKTTSNEQQTFNHLVEEIGELARQYVNQESRKDEYNEKEIEDAIGDIFMQCIKLAHLRGLDIEETVLKVIEREQKLLK
jgi:NTP pyrophosphatase (non-canonical NTP hydrolase)